MNTASYDPLAALSSVKVTGVRQVEGMWVFDLNWDVERTSTYITLDEALSSKVLEITEISEGGSVPKIKVSNKSDSMIFMMSGEILVGCKQNRVLNTSIMVAANSEAHIPVSCVEAGRWGYRSKNFASSRSSSHGRLRQIMARQTSDSYRTRGEAGSDQSAVWSEIERKLGKTGTRSSSRSLHDVVEGHSRRLSNVLEQLPCKDGCNGVAFVISDQVAGVDLYDSPDTLKKLWPKLVNGHALDLLEYSGQEQKSIAPDLVESFLKAAAQGRQERFQSPCKGEDVRIESDRIIGSALLVDQNPVHLQLFQL
jgi:hypothetical protein